MEQRKRSVAVLGSTGSIGKQTLDVISRNSDLFEVDLLTANNNSTLLIEQAIRFKPNNVVICNPSKYGEVKSALAPHYIKVFQGMESICDLVQSSTVDLVVTAMVGFSGLQPTISAIKAGKVIALSNKETLVAAGEIIMSLAAEYGSPIIPVDSEHSAIFQALQGERTKPEKLLLTASGGPFLHTPTKELYKVTPDEALKHPRWKMGSKVTLDSATLMNKGLEVIEAHWLFDMDPEKIEVVIHPQSIIHSMVQFEDGCVMAQLSSPDMRLPIQYALSYPYRIPLDTPRISFDELAELTFFRPDRKRFPCLAIAEESLRRGGNATCAMNGANEIAVEAFLREEIGFMEIPDIISKAVAKVQFIAKPTLDDIYCTNFAAREAAEQIIQNKY
ncbi:MAG TPA: 1-deoxy-D-xylulose-5-phosphate reductoisomerase [Bacteroidales bacterium]|nr:1-deoxy-D-xylulose-5-phosphate reductoisomerase [Bacteroidales bacterium]HQA93713.1 1-deoxy-D-xylulose-5-phosphate reductoisomerase [Bacteroidales bacterium]